jgi:subtilisin family serine protease
MIDPRSYSSWILTGLVLTVGLSLHPSPGHGQTTPVKYWIFFTDKGDVTDRQAAKINRTYISTEAAERRRLRGSVQRPHDDLPVSPTYIDRLKELEITPIVESRWLNAVSAYVTEAQIDSVRELPFVRTIEPVGRQIEPPGQTKSTVFQRTSPPDIPALQLEYGDSRLQLSMINAISPLEQGFNGQDVILGFLDTQFDFNHPSLVHVKNEGRLIDTEDFTGPLVDSTGVANDNYHGLSVSSVALGHAPQSLIGPGYQASVLGATTEYVPAERNQEEDFFVAGLEWLEREGVDVVNVSLGYTTFDSGQMNYTYADMDGNTAVSTRAADRAVSKGVVVVASAGNEGCRSPEECWYYVSAPADGDSVIAVGAVTPDSSRAFFSSRGPTYGDDRIKPDVAALGATSHSNGSARGIYVATRSGYAHSAGTSFASPLVAGVVTQILQANPMLTPMDVREILRSTASQADAPDNSLGWGIINAGSAVNRVRELTYPDRPTFTNTHPNPFVNQTTLTVSMPEDQSQPARVQLYDLLGRKVAVPFSGRLYPGPNTISIDGANLSPGVYLYRVESSSFSESGTIVRAR